MHRTPSLWLALVLVTAATGCAKGTASPPSTESTSATSGGGGAGGGSTSASTGGAGASGVGGSGAGGSGEGGTSTTGAGGGTTSGAGGEGGGGSGSGAGGSGNGGSGGTGGELPHPCGDGVIGPGEECDGANLGDATCVSKGFGGGTLTCTGQCTLDSSKCDACHNGVIQPALGEDCDFDAQQKPLILASCQSLGFMSPNNPGCDPLCNYDLTPCLCGNAMIEGAEQCDGDNLGGKSCADEGFGGGQLACSSTCQFDFGGCTLCGNAQVDGMEACDGNDLGGETCQTQGFTGGQLACSPGCQLNTAGCTLCGNGQIEPGELCDGNNLGGKTCQTQGFTAGQLACSPGCQLNTAGCTTCGNGQIEPGELCDGNNLGGKTCQTQGFTAGQLACTPQCGLSTAGCTKCGNGLLEAGEGCDDGNQQAGDGCSATCQIEILACDPDGHYAIIQGGPVAYTCCGGLVSVNVTSFFFLNDGASVLSSPSNPATMLGAATTCPSGNFSVGSSVAGGCTEGYSLTGSFTGPNTWTGVYTLTFTGPDCDCFGGILGTPCINQVYGITAMR
jgi:cysteine-rich repeat protein